MEDDNALRKVLRDLSISLSEDAGMRDIKFRYDDELGAINQNQQITINPKHAEILEAGNKISEEQEFALIVNTESHEIEHDQVTNVEAMEEFSEEYEDSRPRLAAFVWNVIEDVYIDKRRTDRDRGLRPTLALQADLIREQQKPVTDMEAPYKHANAVLHIGKAGGTPVGFEDVEDEDYKDYCAEVRELIDRARNTPIQSERTEIVRQIMDLIEEYGGNMDTPDLDMPNFMIAVPEDMMDEDGDPLPKPQDQEDDGQDQNGSGGQQGSSGSQQDSSGSQKGEGETNQGGGESGSGKTPNCPNCGFKQPETGSRTVDGMIAARCYPPFDTEADWIGSVEFVAHDDEDGVCGFRVNTDGHVPKDQIQKQGYKVVDTGHSTIEVLEPRNNYDEKETIAEYSCPDCGHDWVPAVGSL